MGPRCPHLQYLRLPPGGAAPFVLICEAFVSLEESASHTRPEWGECGTRDLVAVTNIHI